MNPFLRSLAIVTFASSTFAIIGCDNPHAMGNRSNASEMDRDSRTIPGSINNAGTSTDSSVTSQSQEGRNPSSSGSISGNGMSTNQPTMPTDSNKNGSNSR